MLDSLWQLLNGTLLLTYLLADRLPALVAFALLLLLARGGPEHIQPWLYGVALVGLLGGLVAQAPIPLLLALCCGLALVAVRHDKFNPDTLRWRAMGGIGLYAAAGLGYTIYTGYLQHLQARDWSLFQQGGDHLSLLAQGQGYVQLIGAISLLVVMPLGLIALLMQGLLVHQPVKRTYSDTVTVVTSQPRRKR